VDVEAVVLFFLSSKDDIKFLWMEETLTVCLFEQCSESFIDKVLCDGGVDWKLVAGLLLWLMVGLHCEIHCKLPITIVFVSII